MLILLARGAAPLSLTDITAIGPFDVTHDVTGDQDSGFMVQILALQMAEVIVTYPSVYGPITSYSFDVICDEGYEKPSHLAHNPYMACIPCRPGWYNPKAGDTCDPCPADHYNLWEAQPACWPCKPESTTNGQTAWDKHCVAKSDYYMLLCSPNGGACVDPSDVVGLPESLTVPASGKLAPAWLTDTTTMGGRRRAAFSGSRRLAAEQGPCKAGRIETQPSYDCLPAADPLRVRGGIWTAGPVRLEPDEHGQLELLMTDDSPYVDAEPNYIECAPDACLGNNTCTDWQPPLVLALLNRHECGAQIHNSAARISACG